MSIHGCRHDCTGVLMASTLNPKSQGCCREDLPTFEALPITLEGLLEQGRRLAREQDLVNSHKLSKEYLKDTGGGGGSLIGLQG